VHLVLRIQQSYAAELLEATLAASLRSLETNFECYIRTSGYGSSLIFITIKRVSTALSGNVLLIWGRVRFFVTVTKEKKMINIWCILKLNNSE
jgi:hypothetical protein